MLPFAKLSNDYYAASRTAARASQFCILCLCMCAYICGRLTARLSDSFNLRITKVTMSKFDRYYMQKKVCLRSVVLLRLVRLLQLPLVLKCDIKKLVKFDLLTVGCGSKTILFNPQFAQKSVGKIIIGRHAVCFSRLALELNATAVSRWSPWYIFRLTHQPNHSEGSVEINNEN